MKSHAGLHTALARMSGDRGMQQALAWLETAPRLPRTYATWRAGVGQVSLGEHAAKQPNEVSCGATVATVVNAGYNRELWEQIQTPAGFIRQVERIHTRMRHLKQPLLGLRAPTWPRGLGTPPWGLAAEMAVPGVRYNHRAVNDRDGAVMDDVVDILARATAKGYPVPFYTGGSLRDGLQRAMPRHIVVALPRMSSMKKLRIYEPSTGRVLLMNPHELRRRNEPHPALGNWTNITWFLIPQPIA